MEAHEQTVVMWAMLCIPKPAFLTVSSFHHAACKAPPKRGPPRIGFACSSGFGWGMMKKTVSVQSTPPFNYALSAFVAVRNAG